MRLIGNKTHGDLAEIAIAEFINQYVYDFRAIHVGKDLYRAKSHEEDIKITNEITKEEFPISLKAYGDGPLQLSTDKKSGMFNCLRRITGGCVDKKEIKRIFSDPAFQAFCHINVLPLIYEKKGNVAIYSSLTIPSQWIRPPASSASTPVAGESTRCTVSMTRTAAISARSATAEPVPMPCNAGFGRTRGTGCSILSA